MTAPTLNSSLNFAEWASEVHALAAERDAVILAHNYQVPEIQDVAHHVGDSLALSRIAATAPQSTIVFCGVHFMAETAKILSPDKTVLIPDAAAGCSLADSLTADQLRAWKAENPGAVVVSYVNTTAGSRRRPTSAAPPRMPSRSSGPFRPTPRCCSARTSSSVRTCAGYSAGTTSRSGAASATCTPGSMAAN